jgi:hypothetical protein
LAFHPPLRTAAAYHGKPSHMIQNPPGIGAISWLPAAVRSLGSARDLSSLHRDPRFGVLLKEVKQHAKDAPPH